MTPPNRLDRKPPRNAFAGLGANVHTGNPMVNPTRKNFAGYGPGTAARAKNKLSTPTNRLGLPFRSVADGVNLIESIGKELATGSPFDNTRPVKPNWEDEYQSVIEKYENEVLRGPEFQRGLQRLVTIGATTADVYDLLAPLTPERAPDLHKEYPAGNGPVTPLTALMARIRDRVQEMPHQDVHYPTSPLGEAAKNKRVEAYGRQGMTSKPWRRIFPSQKAFEKWCEKDDGNTTIDGTRDPDA